MFKFFKFVGGLVLSVVVVVLVLGAEGRGLRPRVAGACDALVALQRMLDLPGKSHRD